MTRRLRAFSGGLFGRRHRRILELAGWDVSLGWPRGTDHVGVWGRRPVSWRGRWVARQSRAPLLTVEDGFLRSIHPGVTGEPPLSLILDDLGVHYDAHAPSRLEMLIAEGQEAPDADRLMARLREAGLSKYTPLARDQAVVPKPGYVLLIDQTRHDSSITGAGADADTFRDMLKAARVDNPGTRLIIRAHPDCAVSPKTGHFAASDLNEEEVLLTAPMNPWPLIEGAARVYTVSSQMGFEAVMAGVPVTCFGQPFYAGWGVTDDRRIVRARSAKRSVAQIFTAAYLRCPVYYDPYRDQLTDFEGTVATLARLSDHDARAPHQLVLSGFRAWKRRHTMRFAGAATRPTFRDTAAEAIPLARQKNAHLWLWASKNPDALEQARHAGIKAVNVEDGFLRSVGLGAALVDPASLVFDDIGIYYDATRPSRLEHLIAEAAALPHDAPEMIRARTLRQTLTTRDITKYNVGNAPKLEAPKGQRAILVAGQVEDDASIRLGCGPVRTNRALLEAAREANPDAYVIYKPHPDVEAGLRPGGVPNESLADHIARDTNAAGLIDRVDGVWTLTSLIGFEALLRGKPVTCLGMPFYAGWGLTDDHAPCPRRTARPSLEALIWASLIAYPRYVDPLSHLPCEVELVVERLAGGNIATPPKWQRSLARVQGALAGRGLILWR